MTFKKTMMLSAMALLASLAVLVAMSLWSHAVGAKLMARMDMAHRQALLVARLEADILAREVADAPSRPALDRSVAGTVREYLATIETERTLIDADDESRVYQARERAAARRLATIIRGEAFGPGWIEARGLSHDIATRERLEARDAALSIAKVQARIWAVTWIVALFIVGLWCAMGLMLWRGIVAPIAALVEGTGRLANEQSPARIRPTGLGELRDLAARFNHMAGAVEEQVERRTRALERANRELRDIDGRRRLFLSKVSHELRTPVTVMRGEAEVALRRPAEPSALCEALRHILDNGLFLQRRLDDLLALALAEDGALALAHDRFDLGAVMRQAHAMAAPFARSSGVDLRLAGVSAPVSVVGDEERMRQALVAIIDNGIKFSPPCGSVALDLHMDGDMARIAISDEGPGVPDAELRLIFDPYVQTAAGRSRGGTGLGLSLARWIAGGHGGSIAAANRANGLCVSMTLPVAS